jgi:predicted exporter
MPRLRRPPPLDHPLLYKVISACLIGYGLVLAVLLANTLTEGLNIETRIQAITPQVRDNPAVAEANRVLDRRFADLAVLALAGPDKSAVERAEQSARAMFADAGEAAVKAEQAIYRRYEGLVDIYRPYRFGLLSEADRRRLEEGDAASIRRAAAQRLVGIQSGPRALPFAADPLGLFDKFFQSLPFFENPTAGMAEGYLTDQDARGETEYIKPLILEVTGDALDLDDQRAFVEQLDDIGASLTRQFPSVDVYRSGLVFHSAHAAERSKREFSTISAISMICIIALFAYCFRSLRPLLLGVACLGFGFGAALLVTNRLFADVHILTLVFGAGLIGVAIDYSLHYFAHEYFGHENTGVLNRVLPSLAMGLLTTVAGYACLYQTSMPALYEVATFCITGLVSAWLFVVVLYPRLGANRAPAAVPTFVYRCASVFGSGWRRLGVRKSLAGVAVLALIGAAVLITAGRSENNVRLLYDPPRHILEQDRKITSLLPERSANQYFVVTGADAQEVLQRGEQRRQRMEALVD